MYRNNKVIRRYSEAFKLKILAELSTGKHTKSELCKLYSIAPTSVNEWVRVFLKFQDQGVTNCVSFLFYLFKPFINRGSELLKTMKIGNGRL
jgi:transposase-like protein